MRLKGMQISQVLKRQDSKELQRLLEDGLDPNLQLNSNFLLELAAEAGWLEGVRLLVEHGAIIDINEEEPYFRAVANGHVEVVKYFLEKGASLHKYKEEVSLAAVKTGKLEILELVLEPSSLVVKLDYLFCLAVSNGFLELAKFLLKKGADIQSYGNFALGEGIRRGSRELILFAAENGAWLETTSSTFNGRTALEWAIDEKDVFLARRLLELGARTDFLSSERKDFLEALKLADRMTKPSRF